MAHGGQRRQVQLEAAAAQGAGGSSGQHGCREAESGAAPETVTAEGGAGCQAAARGGAGVGAVPGTTCGGAGVRGRDGDGRREGDGGARKQSCEAETAAHRKILVV
jgi:hypothetical protein